MIIHNLSIAPFFQFNHFAVPFYDIISANNIESEHENEIETDQTRQSATEPDFTIQGKKDRKEKELNLVKGGQSFDVSQERQNLPPRSGGDQKSRYENEGEYLCTLLGLRKNNTIQCCGLCDNAATCKYSYLLPTSRHHVFKKICNTYFIFPLKAQNIR